MRLFFIALVLAVACAAPGRADATPEKQLKTFVAAARKAAAQLPADTPDATLPAMRQPQLSVPALIDYLERLPPPLTLETVQGSVAQISARLASSEKVRQAGDALLATLAADREKRFARSRAEVDTLLAQATQACLAAAVPADLDAPLKALAPYQNPGNTDRLRGMDPAAQQSAARMFQFVTRWQDYLGARQAGDNDRTRQAVYELKNLVDPTLIPRSKLFALPLAATASPTATEDPRAQAWQSLPPVLGRLEKVTTLDELPAILKDLTPLVVAIPDYQPLRDIQDLVASDLSDHQAIQSGKIPPALFSGTDSRLPSLENPRCTDAMRSVFLHLRVELQQEALRWVFKDSGLPQKPDESPDAYIQRVVQAAVGAENWEYALRTLEFYRSLFHNNTSPAWTSRELLSCSTYVAARRLDEAGQIPEAIQAYQDALRATGLLTPVALICSRLAEFKTKQPEAFEAAARLPRVVYLPSNRGFPDGFNRRPAQEDNTYLVPRTEHPFSQ